MDDCSRPRCKSVGETGMPACRPFASDRQAPSRLEGCNLSFPLHAPEKRSVVHLPSRYSLVSPLCAFAYRRCSRISPVWYVSVSASPTTSRLALRAQACGGSSCLSAGEGPRRRPEGVPQKAPSGGSSAVLRGCCVGLPVYLSPSGKDAYVPVHVLPPMAYIRGIYVEAPRPLHLSQVPCWNPIYGQAIACRHHACHYLNLAEC